MIQIPLGFLFGTTPGNPEGITIIQPKVARNELPWVIAHKFTNSERVVSIPYIPLVKFNGVAFQEFPKLILKRNLPVMFLLSGDVISHRLNLRKSDGENAVAILPREIIQVGAFGFQPERRAAFDFLDHFRSLTGARQR